MCNNANWNDVYRYALTENNASLAYECFYKVYRDIFENHFPEKTFKMCHRLTPRHDWMTKGLIKSCFKKSKLYKKYRKNDNALNRNRYIVYRNKF